MEIMGVAFIVLLASLGFLFIISINSRDSSHTEDPHLVYAEDQLSTNFLAAALKTNACEKYTVEDLITACGREFSDQSCNLGSTPCSDAETTIRDMLDKSLKEWDKKYFLTIIYPSGLPTEIKRECEEDQLNYKPAEFYIPIYDRGKTITVRLTICK
jgi:hypothetical protein